MKQTYECHKLNCKHVNSKRTIDQNSALHLYCTHVAQELNASGWTVRKALAYYKIDLEWSMLAVKTLVWKPIQMHLFGKVSTSDLKKGGEIDQVYDHINRFLSNPPFSIHVPFPHDPNKVGAKATKVDSVEYPKEIYQEPTL